MCVSNPIKKTEISNKHKICSITLRVKEQKSYQRLICLKIQCANKDKRKQNFTHNLDRVQIGTISLKGKMKISIKVSA